MEIGIDAVKNFLPHRDPFLFVDSIKGLTFAENVAAKENKEVKDLIGAEVVGLYRTKKEHPIFEGHFPGNPIFPGVIQVEMMAQVSSFGLMSVIPDWENLNMNVVLLSILNSKFRKPIFPEMDLEIRCKCMRIRGSFMTNECAVYNNGELMSEASVMASVKFTP